MLGQSANYCYCCKVEADLENVLMSRLIMSVLALMSAPTVPFFWTFALCPAAHRHW